MVCNIFVSFDPSVLSSSINRERFFYVLLSLGLSVMPFFYFAKPAISGWFLSKVGSVLMPGWIDRTRPKLKGLIPGLFSILGLIIFFNCVSLLPYVFCSTSHLWVAISLGLPIWASLVFSGWESNPIFVRASLVPARSPTVLGPLLAVLETIRVLIRPISLRLRLVVNLAAGHCLLSFVRQAVISLLRLSKGPVIVGLGSGLFMLAAGTGYFVLEVGISFIQAYIFTTLLALYANEHPETNS